jgi:hypothetical protein
MVPDGSDTTECGKIPDAIVSLAQVADGSCQLVCANTEDAPVVFSTRLARIASMRPGTSTSVVFGQLGRRR